MQDWQLRPARDLALGGMARYRSPHRESGLVESGLRLLWWGGVRLWLRLWNGLRVHGGENLPAAGPFVLVHGVGVSGRYMLPVARVLARDHSVYVPDLPGYGKSGRPPRATGIM